MANSAVPSLGTLADAPARLMDRPLMDYFLIELVPILRASAEVATARAERLEGEMVTAGLLPPPPVSKRAEHTTSIATSNTSLVKSAISAAAKGQPEDEEEALRRRLDTIGQHVGTNIVERLCRDRPPITDTLDTIKFVCKDLWVACWDKQVDNLRTNHRGVYVLQDNMFKPIARLSSWEGRTDATRRAKIYVAMSAAIIRGALARLGLQATVVPEITNLPQCTFQVKLR